MTTFKSIKEVKKELLNNCFYIYLVKGESKLRIFDIKTVKGQIKVKAYGSYQLWKNDGWANRSIWIDCTLNEITQQ